MIQRFLSLVSSMFRRPQHVVCNDTPTFDCGRAIFHGMPDLGSGLNYGEIDYVRRHNRRAKAIVRSR